MRVGCKETMLLSSLPLTRRPTHRVVNQEQEELLHERSCLTSHAPPHYLILHACHLGHPPQHTRPYNSQPHRPILHEKSCTLLYLLASCAMGRFLEMTFWSWTLSASASAISASVLSLLSKFKRPPPLRRRGLYGAPCADAPTARRTANAGRSRAPDGAAAPVAHAHASSASAVRQPPSLRSTIGASGKLRGTLAPPKRLRQGVSQQAGLCPGSAAAPLAHRPTRSSSGGRYTVTNVSSWT